MTIASRRLRMFAVLLILLTVHPSKEAPAGFLDWNNLPETGFSCEGKVVGGYYADMETDCQMFHVCTVGLEGEVRDIKFLCLNGTVFDQKTRVCERLDEVECARAGEYYNLNLDLYSSKTTDYNYDYYDTDYDDHLQYDPDDIDTSRTIDNENNESTPSWTADTHESSLHKVPGSQEDEIQGSESMDQSDTAKENKFSRALNLNEATHTPPIIPKLEGTEKKILVSNKTPFLPRVARSLKMDGNSQLLGPLCNVTEDRQFDLQVGSCRMRVSCLHASWETKYSKKLPKCSFTLKGQNNAPRNCSRFLLELCFR